MRMVTSRLGLNRRNLHVGGLLLHTAFRTAVLALLWLSLTGGDLEAWWLGALAVVAATLASLVLLPPMGFWSPLDTIYFLGFFLRRSLAAGVDVARRSFSRGPDLDPAIIEYRLRLPDAAARVFFSNTISLLPGTLGTELRGRDLRVHTLTVKDDIQEELRYAEEVVGRMFAIEPSTDNRIEEPDE